MDARNATPAPAPMEGLLSNPADGRWRMEVARTFHPRGAHRFLWASCGQQIHRPQGPTSFAPLIYAAIYVVENSNWQYHVLVIIADGQVFVQHSERSFHTSDVTSKNNQWEMYSETVPKYRDTKVRTKEPLEQYNQTKDDTDYLWYTTSFRLESDDLPFRNDIRPVLQVKSSAHAMMGFANDAFVGCARRNKQVKGFMFEKPVDLKVGVNHVVLLSSTMGMKDSGGELAEVKGGIQECLIQGLNTGTLDLQVNGWGHKVVYCSWPTSLTTKGLFICHRGICGAGVERVFADKAVPSWREQLTLRAFVINALLAVMFSVIVMKLNLTTGIIPSLNVSVGLLGFFFVCMWTAAAERMGFLRQPFTRQENTVIQTCVVSAYDISFSGGFGSYLFGMSEKIAKQATTVAHIFELPEEKLCLSFLSNNNTGEDETVIFRGDKHYVASRSVSIIWGYRGGMYKEPKFGHLRDLHNIIWSYQKAFLWGQHSSEILGHWYEAHIFELPEEKLCLSFLSNNNTGEDETVIFRGDKHYVASRSVSIIWGYRG
ncbi:putative metal-nicotianamine transporter YSL6, partial [Zea mays]